MASVLAVRDGSREWAVLDLQDVRGEGRLNPRLLLAFSGRPSAGTEVVLEDVTLRLALGQELVGQGRVVDADITYDRAAVHFEVPVSARLLRYCTDTLGPTSTTLSLEAGLHGRARVRLHPNASPSRSWSGAEQVPGQWAPLVLDDGQPSVLHVPRADWYGRVLSPTRNERYRYLEIALPRDDQMFGAEWASAVRLLEQAEAAYASGDDPAVFLHLRGAVEALPGAKKRILEDITDLQKHRHLDTLLKDAVQFLHGGRHVSAGGAQAGTFPVSRTDAAFAVDLMRVLLSHMSLLLALDRP